MKTIFFAGFPRIKILGTFLICITLGTVGFTRPRAAAESPPDFPETYSEPVTLSAGTLKEIIGQQPQNLYFYAYTRNQLHPIPWQWDPMGPDGRVQLEDAPKNDRKIAAQDLLLWMASDMGKKIPKNFLKKKSLIGESKIWLELQLQRPNFAPHWVYLLISSDKEPTSQKDYVSYDPVRDFVQTPYFYLEYADVIRVKQFGWNTPKKGVGPNLLNRVSVRFQARLLLGLIPLKISEEDLVSQTLGYKDGRIRAIKRIASSPKLPFGFKGPSNQTDQFFYRNAYQSSIRIHFPLGSKALISKAQFRVYVAFTPLGQFKIHLPNQKYFQIYPEMPSGVHTVQKGPPSWMHFSGADEKQVFVVAVVIDPNSRTVLKPQRLLYNHEDKLLNSTEENQDKTMGTLSFDVAIASEKGDHSFQLYLFAPDPQKTSTNPTQLMKNLVQILAYPISLHDYRVIQ